MRRYFVNDSDKRALSMLAPNDDTVAMWLRMGFREVTARTEYLAFRREYRPSGEHHVWFTSAENTAIAHAAKKAGVSEEAYIRACVHLHMRGSN